MSVTRETGKPLKHPMEAKCAWCEHGFSLRSAPQLGALNRGANVFCSRTCLSAYHNHNARTHLLGPCPVCGKMFESRRRKKRWCSIECYNADPHTLARLRALNEEKKRPPGACPECGGSVSHRTKYCNQLCRRRYFAARFDRWIASPQKIALPQCFDEFLAATELPCLIEGCEWRGKHLGYHVNVVHGITADKLRELAGFNKTSGLVSSDLSERLSARPHLYANATERGELLQANQHKASSQRGRKIRLEGREHGRKARALLIAERSVPGAQRFKPCRHCGSPVQQPAMGHKLYCNTRCRTAYYAQTGRAELICSFCGARFMGSVYQVRSVRKGNKVCCSVDCRNKMNITACLTSQGRRLPAFAVSQ